MDVKKKTILQNHPQQKGFSISMISLFESIKNKYDVYRGEDSTEKLCKWLKE